MADTTPSTGSDGQRPQRGPGLVLASLSPAQRKAALAAGLYSMPPAYDLPPEQPGSTSWIN